MMLKLQLHSNKVVTLVSCVHQLYHLLQLGFADHGNNRLPQSSTICVGNQQHVVCLRENADHSMSLRESVQNHNFGTTTQAYRALEITPSCAITARKEMVITTQNRTPQVNSVAKP